MNSGILEKRKGNLEAALAHFYAAREIEPTYCECDYWIGATFIQAKKPHDGISKLEEALDCVYTASNALKALNKVYVAFSEVYRDNPVLYSVSILGMNP